MSVEPTPKPSAIQKAKDTLLRVLDQLEAAERDLGREPDRVDLCVVYSMGHDEPQGGYHEVGGWASTPGPSWMHGALLRRAAVSQENSVTTSPPEDVDGT